MGGIAPAMTIPFPTYSPAYDKSIAESVTYDPKKAKDLLNATAEACGWSAPRVLAEFPGSRLEKTVFRHPFLDRDSLGILGELPVQPDLFQLGGAFRFVVHRCLNMIGAPFKGAAALDLIVPRFDQMEGQL